MSYSFSFTAANKADAKVQVANELAGVVNGQPGHAADAPAVQAMADAFIDGLGDDSNKDVKVVAYGSISGPWADGKYVELTSASCSMSVELVAKTA